MDLNHILMWLVGLTTAVQLTAIIRATAVSENRGWVAMLAAIVVLLVFGCVTMPDSAGLITAAVWLPLVLAPAIGNRILLRLTTMKEFRKASRLARLLSWLHPADGWRERVDLLRALELAQGGDVGRAVEILQRIETPTTWTGRLAISYRFRLQDRWHDYVEWFEDTVHNGNLRIDVNLAAQYIRALGEIGSIDRMVQAYGTFKDGMPASGYTEILATARLFVFAFTGHRDAVACILDGPLTSHPQDVKLYWRGTAALAAGDGAAAAREFDAIHTGSDQLIRSEIEARLRDGAVAGSAFLGPHATTVMKEAYATAKRERRHHYPAAVAYRQAWLTYVLVVLNLITFVAEIVKGGATDADVLYALGAATPHDILEGGQGWRLLSSVFLHYGAFHLILNMLALIILGPFLEFFIGKWRYALTYLLAGTGSMIILAFASRPSAGEIEIFIGASGAIMGVMGAIAAIYLCQWRRQRSHEARARLLLIAFLFVVQSVYDLATPEVSSIAHVSGVAIGFLVGLLAIGWGAITKG